jgi:glycosyltransferase involved in cell wall biosynthesis
MKITLITVTYNSIKTIRHTIESVLNQTYPNIEYIIIDGKSTDNTLDIIKEYEPKFDGRMKWISEPDEGIYDAMNKGIRMATGDLVGILNSDDFYSHNNVISDVINHFHNTICEVVYGDIVYINSIDTNKIVRYWKAGEYRENLFKWGWMPPHPSLFVKKYIYEKYGHFNRNLGSSSDYEFMLRIIHKEKVKIAYLSEILVKMRLGGQSNASIKNRIRANNEDRLAWRINNIKPYFFTLYLKPLRKIFQYVRKPKHIPVVSSLPDTFSSTWTPSQTTTLSTPNTTT